MKTCRDLATVGAGKIFVTSRKNMPGPGKNGDSAGYRFGKSRENLPCAGNIGAEKVAGKTCRGLARVTADRKVGF